MNLFRLFVDEEKIESKIVELLEKKNNLKQIVNEGVNERLKKEFPDKNYEHMRTKNKELVEEIENSLYREFSDEIDIKISQLQLLRKELVKNYA